MTTGVHVNLHAYSATHVSNGMLQGLRKIIRGTGLDLSYLTNRWDVLDSGITAWLRSGHLKGLVLEVYDPSHKTGDDLVGRFDFTIDYGYSSDGDGELWLDSEAVAFAIRKNGSYPGACDYRIIADTAPGYPAVDGWSSTSFRSTSGFTRHSIGTAITGGSLGAGISYYAKDN